MVITKKVLGQLERAYATAIMEIDGDINYLVASEGNNACFAFNENNGESMKVWDSPGGTMNIVAIPGRENEFIATQLFIPTFQAKDSKIVHAKYENGLWTVKDIMTIPYLHRFDVVVLDNTRCFIGATLCQEKESKDDWSKPGKVYIGEIPEDISAFKLQPILHDITKNHGFWRGNWNNREAVLISGVEGVFVIYLPAEISGKWEIEQLLDYEVSDIAVCDIDNDGCMELATIEPFHGSEGVIYKYKEGKLIPIHKHEYEFGHVVWGGTILDKPSFIIGGRKGNRELNCFQMDEFGKIVHFTIDNTSGPSNIAVLNKEKCDVILAANREIGEMAIYEITK